MIQMSVVIAIFLRRVKLINGVSAWLAQKQLHDHSIIHREYGRSARRHEIRCFMLSPSFAADLIECILDVRCSQTFQRQRDMEWVIGSKTGIWRPSHHCRQALARDGPGGCPWRSNRLRHYLRPALTAKV